MADEAPKKRSFRKYSYRGVDLEQLLDMSTDELVELFGARQRRRCVPSHPHAAHHPSLSLLPSLTHSPLLSVVSTGSSAA